MATNDDDNIVNVWMLPHNVCKWFVVWFSRRECASERAKEMRIVEHPTEKSQNELECVSIHRRKSNGWNLNYIRKKRKKKRKRIKWNKFHLTRKIACRGVFKNCNCGFVRHKRGIKFKFRFSCGFSAKWRNTRKARPAHCRIIAPLSFSVHLAHSPSQSTSNS